jgi:hypothetical protein
MDFWSGSYRLTDQLLVSQLKDCKATLNVLVQQTSLYDKSHPVLPGRFPGVPSSLIIGLFAGESYTGAAQRHFSSRPGIPGFL